MNSVLAVEAVRGCRWNKERLAARFQRGIEWGARHGVPLYCGEFGVILDHPRPEHRANWFRDFGQILAEHRIGWAVWDWEGSFGLDRRDVDGKPQVDQVVVRALTAEKGTGVFSGLTSLLCSRRNLQNRTWHPEPSCPDENVRTASGDARPNPLDFLLRHRLVYQP